MNYKRSLWLILDLVFLVVFNIVFFVTDGADHEPSVWIAYGFVHLSYIMLLVTPFLVRKSNVAVLGLSLYAVSYAYFVIAFLVNLGFMISHPEEYKACLIVNVILAGVYVVVLVSNMLANESTIDTMELHDLEVRYVRDCSFRLKGIMDQVTDNQLKKQVEKTYDNIHSSQTKSNSSARQYELAVIDLLYDLEYSILQGDYASAESILKNINKNATERNRALMYSR